MHGALREQPWEASTELTPVFRDAEDTGIWSQSGWTDRPWPGSQDHCRSILKPPLQKGPGETTGLIASIYTKGKLRLRV